MNPQDLHPDLGPGPEPKRVCVACTATEPDAILVPFLASPSIFVCGSCAVNAAFDSFAEGGRQICMHLLNADATGFMRNA